MPSISDIPKYLLKPEAKIDFIAWINTFPLDDSAKRKLISRWTDSTGARFSMADFEYSGLYDND